MRGRAVGNVTSQVKYSKLQYMVLQQKLLTIFNEFLVFTKNAVSFIDFAYFLECSDFWKGGYTKIRKNQENGQIQIVSANL